ncbi:MAG: hypothetical protein HY403_06325 [Elusimicrobia bacterium]|nr:hypothetical protein [Elusimicrobiota bacterium]
MSDEPRHQTSRAGLLAVLFAVGGSAVGVAGWHLLSNRDPGLDTSGFDMSAGPEPARFAAPPSSPAAPSDAPPPRTSLGMVRADAGLRVAGTGGTAPPSGGGKAPADPKSAAALTFEEAAMKHERFVASFIRRMEAKHPSISQYGKDWAASPELRALRDQYWREKDPLKFAYGLSKSNDFARLVKKYAGDPGIRDVLITGIKEAPPGLIGAVGGLFQNDKITKDLMTTIVKSMGLPASLTGFLGGDDAKPPDQSRIMSDIMNSEDMKKALGR